MFQGKTITEIRSMLAEGEATNDEVVAELESRHAKRLANGKGSTWPARGLYHELTGKELPGTKLVQTAAKAKAKSQPKAAKGKAKPKAPTEPATTVDAELAQRYAKVSTKQLENWLRRAKPDGDKAIAIQAELDRRSQPKADAPAKGSALDAVRNALEGASEDEVNRVAALLASIVKK